MENATKALLMAGAVLIAIIIISLLVRTYGNMGQFQRQQLSVEEAEKLEAYNKEYTKYLNQYVYGTEVITVINKVLSSDYDIKVTMKFEDDYTYQKPTYKNGKKTKKTVTVKSGKDLTITNDDEEYMGIAIDDKSASFGSSVENEDGDTIVTGLKNKAFKCVEIGYDNSTGRVNKIRFEEKQYGDIE